MLEKFEIMSDYADMNLEDRYLRILSKVEAAQISAKSNGGECLFTHEVNGLTSNFQ